FPVILERILRIGRIDRHRARPQRFLDVEDGGQWIVGHAHQVEGLARGPLARRPDSEDRFTLVAHDVARQGWLVILAEVDQTESRVELDGHVSGPNDPLDPRRTRGGLVVDRANARVRMRTSQDLQMQQVGEAMVVVVGRGAGDVPEYVLTWGRLTNL